MTVAHEYEERLSEERPALPALDWLLHQTRYLFATRYTRGLRVLDFGCGTGYGSEILSRYGAATVTGVDISDEALEEARRRHLRPGVSFERGDVFDPPVAGPFDIAVSFETLEHVHDPGRMLDEVARLLTADGVLVCSSPNRTLTNPGAPRHARPANPYHLVELTHEELRGELRLRFREVRMYGQAYSLPWRRIRGRHISRAAEALAWASAWPTRLPFQPLYSVAVCRGPLR